MCVRECARMRVHVWVCACACETSKHNHEVLLMQDAVYISIHDRSVSQETQRI